MNIQLKIVLFISIFVGELHCEEEKLELVVDNELTSEKENDKIVSLDQPPNDLNSALLSEINNSELPENPFAIKNKRCPKYRLGSTLNGGSLSPNSVSGDDKKNNKLYETICKTCLIRNKCKDLNNCQLCEKWCTKVCSENDKDAEKQTEDDLVSMTSRGSFNENENEKNPGVYTITLDHGILMEIILNLFGVFNSEDVASMTITVKSKGEDSIPLHNFEFSLDEESSAKIAQKLDKLKTIIIQKLASYKNNNQNEVYELISEIVTKLQAEDETSSNSKDSSLVGSPSNAELVSRFKDPEPTANLIHQSLMNPDIIEESPDMSKIKDQLVRNSNLLGRTAEIQQNKYETLGSKDFFNKNEPTLGKISESTIPNKATDDPNFEEKEIHTTGAVSADVNHLLQKINNLNFKSNPHEVMERLQLQHNSDHKLGEAISTQRDSEDRIPINHLYNHPHFTQHSNFPYHRSNEKDEILNKFHPSQYQQSLNSQQDYNFIGQPIHEREDSQLSSRMNPQQNHNRQIHINSNPDSFVGQPFSNIDNQLNSKPSSQYNDYFLGQPVRNTENHLIPKPDSIYREPIQGSELNSRVGAMHSDRQSGNPFIISQSAREALIPAKQPNFNTNNSPLHNPSYFRSRSNELENSQIASPQSKNDDFTDSNVGSSIISHHNHHPHMHSNNLHHHDWPHNSPKHPNHHQHHHQHNRFRTNEDEDTGTKVSNSLPENFLVGSVQSANNDLSDGNLKHSFYVPNKHSSHYHSFRTNEDEGKEQVGSPNGNLVGSIESNIETQKNNFAATTSEFMKRLKDSQLALQKENFEKARANAYSVVETKPSKEALKTIETIPEASKTVAVNTLDRSQTVLDNLSQKIGTLAKRINEDIVGSQPLESSFERVQPDDSLIRHQFYNSRLGNVKENIPQEDHLKAVNPDSSFNRINEKLGLSSRGNFDGITVESNSLGSMIPGEKGIDISFKKPSDVYFIGKGIKLPLQMVTKEDGAIHFSVDIDKLCSCNNTSCPKNHSAKELEQTVETILEKEAQLKDQLEDLGNVPVGMPSPHSGNENVDDGFDRNQRDIVSNNFINVKNGIASRFNSLEQHNGFMSKRSADESDAEMSLIKEMPENNLELKNFVDENTLKNVNLVSDVEKEKPTNTERVFINDGKKGSILNVDVPGAGQLSNFFKDFIEKRMDDLKKAFSNIPNGVQTLTNRLQIPNEKSDVTQQQNSFFGLKTLEDNNENMIPISKLYKFKGLEDQLNKNMENIQKNVNNYSKLDDKLFENESAALNGFNEDPLVQKEIGLVSDVLDFFRKLAVDGVKQKNT